MGQHSFESARQSFSVARRCTLVCALIFAGACDSEKDTPQVPLPSAPSVTPTLPEQPTPQDTIDVHAAATEPFNDEIVIAGQRFSIGAPVVLWSDPGGYDAYSTEPFFEGEPRADGPTGLRYKPGRARGTEDFIEPSLNELASLIDQFVLHFDVCGVSRQCFKVLQDIRGLSVHFMLDIDGTLYQTLDLRETAWHARQANPRSIGIEIANIGAYAPDRASDLDKWYTRDEFGWRIALPERLGDGGVRTPDFVGRPARPERVRGVIQNDELEQFDFTAQQYDTLVKLSVVLCKVLPNIEPDAPRDARGIVRTGALSPGDFESFRGILGHDHITSGKSDPGPAMDWERFLDRVREKL